MQKSGGVVESSAGGAGGGAGEECQNTNPEMIRLYVVPQVDTNDFHEVTPSQLEDYLTECKYEKRNKNHKRNLYHQLGIIAKVDTNTTELELNRLLQSDVRTLMVQMNCNKPQDLDHIFLNINTAVDKLYIESMYRTPIGIAVEINGELLTTGRMRNDICPFVQEGHIMVLTTNEEYKYCCFKEIVYVSNLWRYLHVLKLGDCISFNNHEIVARVLKCSSIRPQTCGSTRPITVEVVRPGHLGNYMSVSVPYYIEAKELAEKDIADIERAIKFGAHFLVIPGLRSSAFLHALREHIGPELMLIGSFDFDHVESKFIDIGDHLLELDALWMDTLFTPTRQERLAGAVNQCHTFEKTIVGTVPLRTCSDFKKLENHERIKLMDCLLIEKSPLRKKFPLIAKKLLPIGNKQIEVPPLETLSCGDGIVNFVLRTIYSIPCKGIVVSNTCPKAALAFAIPEIYCPVIAVVANDRMARLFNLRRNLKSIVYTTGSAPTGYGIAYAREQGFFQTGDFIISISDSMDDKSQLCVNLRAYYLPPS